jgi:hypothetical protein
MQDYNSQMEQNRSLQSNAVIFNLQLATCPPPSTSRFICEHTVFTVVRIHRGYHALSFINWQVYQPPNECFTWQALRRFKHLFGTIWNLSTNHLKVLPLVWELTLFPVAVELRDYRVFRQKE